MEGNASEIPLLGKLAAWPPLPIQTGDQDDDFCFVAEETIEGDGAGESHQCNKCKEKRKRRQKKRYPRSPELEVQPWQAQGSELLYVVSAGPGLEIRTNWLGRRAWWMMTHSPTVPKGGWL